MRELDEDGGRQIPHKPCSISYIKTAIKDGIDGSYSREATPNSFTSKIE